MLNLYSTLYLLRTRKPDLKDIAYKNMKSLYKGITDDQIGKLTDLMDPEKKGFSDVDINASDHQEVYSDVADVVASNTFLRSWQADVRKNMKKRAEVFEENLNKMMDDDTLKLFSVEDIGVIRSIATFNYQDHDDIVYADLVDQGDEICWKEAQELAYRSVIGIAHDMFKKIYKGAAQGREDCVESAAIAIINALTSWCPSKGKFTTYVTYKMRGGILDEIRSNTGLSATEASNLRKVTEARTVLTEKLGHEPTIRNICNHTGLSTLVVERTMTMSAKKSSLSDEAVNAQLEAMSTNSLSVEDQAFQNMHYNTLYDAIKTLPPLNQQVLYHLFWVKDTVEGTAEKIGLSKSTVKNIKDRSVILLRKDRNLKKVSDYGFEGSPSRMDGLECCRYLQDETVLRNGLGELVDCSSFIF